MEPAAPGTQVPVVDELPDRLAPVSGVIFDPEAIFYSWITWPGDPAEAPPPALLHGLPTVIRAAGWGAQISMLGPTGEPADSSGPALPPWGSFQTKGLSPDPNNVYLMQAAPSDGFTIGANDLFPAEAGFAPVPAVPYYPTTTLRPVAPTAGQCIIQAAAIVGEGGAIGAVAKAMTAAGTPTTPASLADPASGTSVLLVWLYSPSPLLDLFMFPSGDVAAEASVGTLYAIDWAPPSGAPAESAMGFTATRNGVSSIGYYALVVPPASAGPVALSFNDTSTEEGRPWTYNALELPGLLPGVTFARLLPSEEEEPPGDYIEDGGEGQDFSFLCFPPSGEE